MNSLPLPLAHVLADEDARLYGAGDAPRERRWLLRDEEVIDARALAQKLAQRIPNALENISRWREENGHDPVYRKRVIDEVNELLESIAPTRWLYEHEAFEDAKVEPYSDLRVATSFDPDEVFNLNREMFDGLFRDDVRSAADLRFKEFVAGIHKRAKEGTLRSAIALSGGGIRSATYALGMLQGLARRHVLEKFDFLSTISGGGYIGGWLSSWVRRDPWGIRGVSEQLSSEPDDPLDPEPLPLKHLRAYSNYLIPRLSFFSADTWALVATYIRNVMLNWMVLIPLLAGLMAIPRLVFSAVVREPSGSETAYAWTTGLGLLLVGFLILIWYRPVREATTTNNLTDGRFITWCLLPLTASAIALVLAWAWHVNSGGTEVYDINPLLFFGVALSSTMIAFFVFLVRFHSQFPEKGMEAKAWQKRRSLRILAELGGAVASGLTSGLLSWLATVILFPKPVEAIQSVGVVSWPTDPVALSAGTAMYVCFSVPILLGILFLQGVIFVGASSHYNQDFDREWWARASGWVLLAALGWAGLSAVTIYGPVAIHYMPRALTALGGASGLFSVLAGRSNKTKGTSQGETTQSKSSTLMDIGLALAVPIFVLYILAAISLGTSWALSQATSFQRLSSQQIAYQKYLAEHAHREYPVLIASKPASVKETPLANAERERSYEDLKIVEMTPWWVALAIVIGCLSLARLVSQCIGVNVFSMHAMYRNRLVRAYLGASRWSRTPNQFTGFDPQDNLPMHDLRPEYLWWHSFRDIDNAIGLVANARTPELQLINAELCKELGGDMLDRLFNPETDRSIAQPAFYQSLNVLIATRDLVFLHNPSTGPARDPRRALRNRRFIEMAFGDSQIYPSPMPLLCARDILAASEFAHLHNATSEAATELRKLFKHARHDPLDQINEVIAEASLKDVPFFAGLKIDVRPFRFREAGPVHHMIDNRLRLVAAFPKIFAPLALPRPLHVLGICLNLSSGEDLAWQQRKAESFAVTPLASGSRQLGYRDTRTYGDISLGTAVTISGAAASPNMGYHTSPALAFLMTLFNVRLGWWLGNPGLAGNDTYQLRNPRVSLHPLVRELTGNTDDKYRYVYLSDGGHFENLGLYEMVLRRVHRIVVSDGSGDPTYTYNDLGNAIRKIRIDLGIEIEIKEIEIIPPTEKGPGKYCAFGEIHYCAADGPDAVTGQLLYIKPVVYKNEGPRDVLNYATTSSTFPQESTGDQFFTESQFESYRRLGLYTVEEICGGHEPLESVDDFIKKAKGYLHHVCDHGHHFACGR